MADRCPTCDRPLPRRAQPRTLKCWACGVTFTQALGRRRIVCTDPRCQRRRAAYRRRSGAALDRMEG